MPMVPNAYTVFKTLLPAREISTSIGRGPKYVKWDRKEFIVYQSSIDREQGHHQDDITTTKYHPCYVPKFLFNKINQTKVTTTYVRK